MNWLRKIGWKIFKKLLFRIDAETAHKVTILMIRFGIRLGNFPLRVVSGSAKEGPQRQGSCVFGMEFLSRVGLAAGFDKNCEVLRGLPSLGFGFVEIGTVTPRPQPGNDRPRLFRDVENKALFNRMGFNGLGASLVAERLAQAKCKLPDRFRVGVNLGKNKDTPLESAHLDYIRAARAFEGLADYLVINVSSPNTPGLRSLQTADALRLITEGMMALICGWKRKVPLLLKLAPELKGHELSDLIESLERSGNIDGWVLTNTRSEARLVNSRQVEGGLSGKPLQHEARDRLIEVRQLSQKPILSVGGILSVEEAQLRISSGADLVQIYTGWIYQGPHFPVELSQKL